MLARGQKSVLLVLGDALWLLAAVPIAALLRLGPGSDLFHNPGFLLAVGALNAAVYVPSFYYNDLYDLRTLAHESALLARVARSLAVGMVVVAVLYYLLPSLMVGRGILLLVAALVAGWACVSRTFLTFASRSAFHERILILGAGETALEIGREILGRKKLGYELIGFLDKTPERLGVSILNPRIVGTWKDLVPVCQRGRVDRVLVCLKDRRGTLPTAELLDARTRGIEVEDGASFAERLTGRIPVRDITPSWFIFGPGFRQPRLALGVKRAIDVTVSILGLVVCAPLLALVALAVRAESAGPALFRQERVGRRGRPFVLYKFRSMRMDAEKDGPRWAVAADDRVTRVGRVLRVSRLDELPQLWNVLKGDMSLVGPRPERPMFVEMLSRSLPFYDMRHVVRPGLTGWAQVKWRYGASEEDAMTKLQYDLYYIKHLAIRRDLLILFDTLKVMLLGEGAR